MPKKPRAPECLHCGRVAVLSRTSAHIFGGRDWGPVWECKPCGARSGCHPGTTRALGPPADANTREARQQAHAAFDPLWRAKMARDRCGKGRARRAAYRWLAKQLQLRADYCHIGMMDAETAWRVVAVCRPHLERIRAA